MKLKMIPLAAAAVFASVPFAASAETADGTASETRMAMAAKISLAQAQDIALAQHSGTLAAIGFNDENGRGVYEATVIGTDGQGWLVKLDADTGAILGQGLAALIDDEASGDQDHGGEKAEGRDADDDADSETDDDANG